VASRVNSGQQRLFYYIAGMAVLAAIAVGPFVSSDFRLLLWAQAFLYAMTAVSLDIVWGQAGIPDMGHSVWFGLGALSVGLMTTTVSDTGLVMEAGGTLPQYIAAVLIGSVSAGLAAGIVAWYSCSRGTSHFYIAVVGLALSTAIQPLYTQFPNITGGENGLFGFGYDKISIPGWYVITAIAFLLVTAATYVLARSDFGLVVRAVRDNERRARYLGINVEHVKIVIYALGGAGAGLAGALFAAMLGAVSAPLFGFLFATDILVWVAVGGRATIIGPAIAAIALSLIGSELNRSLPSQWGLLVGALFVIVVVFVPDGILPPFVDRIRRLFNARGLHMFTEGRTLIAAPKTVKAVTSEASPIVIEDVKFAYGALQVLRGIDLTLERGELLSVVGPNGAGKSTLINVLTDGQFTATTGKIVFNLGNGTPHKGSAPQDILRAGIARKFQIPALFPTLTVAEHVLLATMRGRWPSWWRRTRQVAVPQVVLDVVNATGLASRENVPAPALSHGLKQGLEIAMAAAAEPQVLILDEPTAGLSANEREVVGQIMQELIANKITIVLVEHDLDFVYRIATRIAVLHDGRVLETGKPEQVASSRIVREAYLGTAVEAPALAAGSA
jgi:branched-chain amino acid transport system permease protein